MRSSLSKITPAVLAVCTLALSTFPLRAETSSSLDHRHAIPATDLRYNVSAKCPHGSIEMSVEAQATFYPSGSEKKGTASNRIDFVRFSGVELKDTEVAKLENLIQDRTINFLYFVSCGMQESPEIRALVGLNSLEVGKIGTEVFDFVIKDNKVSL